MAADEIIMKIQAGSGCHIVNEKCQYQYLGGRLCITTARWL